jgi:hypothetical protein
MSDDAELGEHVCPECGSLGVSVIFDDAELGERGPYTIACYDCPHEFYVPEEATARSRIGALRAIVRDHKAARIDGYIVDAFTAQMLVKVYEALSPASREKFGKPNLERLVSLGWSVVS